MLLLNRTENTPSNIQEKNSLHSKWIQDALASQFFYQLQKSFANSKWFLSFQLFFWSFESFFSVSWATFSALDDYWIFLFFFQFLMLPILSSLSLSTALLTFSASQPNHHLKANSLVSKPNSQPKCLISQLNLKVLSKISYFWTRLPSQKIPGLSWILNFPLLKKESFFLQRTFP